VVFIVILILSWWKRRDDGLGDKLYFAADRVRSALHVSIIGARGKPGRLC